MKRIQMKELVDWKNSQTRKPLVIKGVRQSGKTWIMKEFGRTEYENFAYFNFERNENLNSIFDNPSSPQKVIEKLIVVFGENIYPEKTLIILDEIQKCMKAYTYLKYFHEEANEYHIICAGSLLGVTIAETGVEPVGKVEFLYLNPLSFTEFLIANNEQNYVEYFEKITDIENIPDEMFHSLINSFKLYLFLGGLPEVLNTWFVTKNIKSIKKIKESLIIGYINDFRNVKDGQVESKVKEVFNAIPDNLSKVSKRFNYSSISKNARKRDYGSAVDWLERAHLIQRSFKKTNPLSSLRSDTDKDFYRLYFSDTGILTNIYDTAFKNVALDNTILSDENNALSINYVQNTLCRLFGETRYWVPEDTKNDRVEMDFLINFEHKTYPIIVNIPLSRKNVNKFKKMYPNKAEPIILINDKKLMLNDNVFYIPIFLVDFLIYFLNVIK